MDIAEEEKAHVQKVAEEFVGAGAEVTYFDASLFKQVGNGEKTPIHEPGRLISVTIVIPENIRNKDVLMVRNYQIIRLHDGKTDIIEGTYNEGSAEFTFETDKFSTYANKEKVILSLTNKEYKKTCKIRVKVKKENSKMKFLSYAAKLRYYTDDKKVAKVSKTGKITAKGKGKCTVYVIANNGVCKKMTVTVKNKKTGCSCMKCLI